ncbi:MAG: GDP-mannose 4,6-dehydratase [Deltaproteobacteria bacterium]|nr:GDP-mannose 4,6-dehydratase [Deltaproteobacteria bacterium]
MNVLLTGGAGFIGRWVAKRLLDIRAGRFLPAGVTPDQASRLNLIILDNFSNGREANLRDLAGVDGLTEVVAGDIKDRGLLSRLFKTRFDLCLHLAASINVQDSIDDPRTTFENDVTGTFNVLEECRGAGTRMVFMSTCMVYDRCLDAGGITETHPVKPASPYAGSKLSGENLALSYYYAYRLPVTVIRPFNTYGPFQKSSGEGGVVAIFVNNRLANRPLMIYGAGEQTRDLMYVTDCADFVLACAFQERAVGELINAGSGYDVTINHLAEMIAEGRVPVLHVAHIHPQSEIMKLLCDYGKAEKLLGWRPQVSLDQGIALTRDWIKSTNDVQ